MSSLLCCVSCRRPSPDLPNVRLASSASDNSRGFLQRSHVPRSTGTLDSTGSEDRQELRRIFDSSQEQSDEKGSSRKQGYSSGSTDTRARHRSSTSRLQDVLKKRLSRDSGFSAKSSRRKSKVNLSEEDIERRKELKRALHRRLRDELLKDQAASQGGYDPDAEIIQTPKVTKSRSGGAIQISPKGLSDIMRRLKSESACQDLWQVPEVGPDSGKRIGYEHTNASKVTSVWDDDLPYTEPNPLDAADEIKQILSSPKTRSIEVVHGIPPSNSTSRHSLLNRSDTVIRVPFSKDSIPKRTSTMSTEAPVEPPSPGIFPLRMPSITESVQRDWRLSLTANREDSVPNLVCTMIDKQIDPHSHTPSRPSNPEDWHVEAIGLLDSFGRWKGLGNGHAKKHLITSGRTHRCDPASEERDFGGVDGENSHTEVSECVNSSREMEAADGDSRDERVRVEEPWQSLAPKTLVSAISLPQLPNIARHSRNKSSGNYSMTYSVGGRRARYSSSSGYGAPVINRCITIDNASSVYTFPVESYTSSPRDSIAQLGNFSDKLQKLQTSDTGPIPIYAGNNDLDTSSASLGQEPRGASHSRRRTIDTTSFQSSTDSFRARELAAAARIVPKPRTLTKPKVSRFKEELIDETAKAKSLGRKSMLGRGFGKRGNFRSYDGSEEWYSTGKRQGYGFSFVAEEGETAASMWERALKDHATETATPSSKRPGSLSQAFGRRSMRDRVGGTKVKTKPSAGLRSISTPSRGQGLKIDIQVNQSGQKAVTPANKKIGGKSSPTKSIALSWSKYPSHTRAERSMTPAGKADDVTAHDFASNPTNTPKSRSSFRGKRKKSRSMTFGKNVFKSWSRLYKSLSSSDVKNQARGFRSSTSPGYEPEYPELEIYGLSLPTLKAPTQQHARSALSTEVEEGDLTSSQETDPPITDRSANAWSKLYEDCVKSPNDTDTEAGSVANFTVSQSHPGTVTSITPRHQRELSSASGANMRESTVDFQRSLRVHEVEARKSVLEAAEKAWAA